MQVKTNCEVYLSYQDGRGWKSDELQKIGFVKKNEKVEDQYGNKMVIHQKNFSGTETVILPETSDDDAFITIFVK